MMTRTRMGVVAIAVTWAGTLLAQGQGEPPDITSRDETAPVLPTPASLAIWTDRPGYLAWRDLIRVYLATDPSSDLRLFSEVVFLENIESGQRKYLVSKRDARWLQDDVVDLGGRDPGWLSAWRIASRPPTRIWAGRSLEPGLWQFVIELRRPDSTEIVKRAHAKFIVSDRVPLVIGAGGRDTEIATDTTWTNDRIRALQGRVFVKAGTTLTIEPGTLVLARGSEAAIVIERGGRIIAQGYPDAPIVMTCDEAVGNRFEGCWGGLTILGSAPVTPGSKAAKGIVTPTRAVYGGQDPLDSSGVLQYVRVEFAGAGSTAGTMGSGLGFYGVGSGTLIDHVQSHASAGDGFRFVGGTAGCRYCVSSGALGDGLRWAQGWQGTAQYLFLQQGPSGGGCGIDGDHSGPDPGAAPRPLPKFYNLTMVGSKAHGPTDSAHGSGIMLHGKSAVIARNAIVTGFATDAIEARDGSGSLFQDGTSSIAHAILFDNGGRLGGRQQTTGTVELGAYCLRAAPKLVNARYSANPDPRPKLQSPALQIGAGTVPPSDGFLDTGAQWIGAFGDSNWLEEWTFFGQESDYREVTPGGMN